MDSIWLDLRYAARSLRRRPGFSAIAVLTLALGIGVNAVAFSAIDALLLRPFRIADADRIGWIMVPGPGNPRGYATTPELDALSRAASSFEGIAAEARVPVSVQANSGAEQGWALLVTSNYLRLLDVTPVLGRIFTESDVKGSDLPAVVSYRFWSEALGAPGSLSGQQLVVNGRAFSVVGVLADDFQGPGGLYAPDMWLPLEQMNVLNVPEARTKGPWLTLFGRVRDRAPLAQARTELAAAAAAFSNGNGSGADGRRTGVFYPMKDGHPDLREIRKAAWLALAVVGVVLLIACFNVASLLMARAAERQKEISVRAAVGASRSRILRQLTIEGLMLASAGGAASLVVASWSGRLLATFALPSPIPQRLHLGVDGMLVAFTAGLVLIAGTLPVLLPALQATRADLLRTMRMESALGARPSRARNAFVTLQIAGSTLFIVAALLFVRSFVKSASTSTGFDTERTVVLQLTPSAYGYSGERSRLFFEALRARLVAIPGVHHVALADRVPFYVGYPASEEYSIDAADCAAADCRRAVVYSVGPDHFAALGIPLIAGRELNAQDTTAQEIVISRHLAAQLWPGESAIGRAIRLGPESVPATVVGVAEDIKHRNMQESADSYIYRPLRAHDYAAGLSVIVQAETEPRLLLATIREHVRALDPALPPGSLTTMKERMKMPLWPSRTAAGFLTICASLAVVLASIGLFGVMHFSVAQRTRELGVRSALGATRARIMTAVIQEGLRLTVPGIALGGVAGFIAGRLLTRALFGISPADPVSFTATVLIELTVGLLACALPAYRATRVDPLVALRQNG
jgi:predicted permease